MNTDSDDPLGRILRTARWRLSCGVFLQNAVTLLLCLGLLLLVLAAVQRWVLHVEPFPLRWIAAAIAACVLLAAAAALFRPVGSAKVAALLDRRGKTHDRFVTALAFAKAEDSFHTLAARECRDFLAKGNFAKLTPVRIPYGTAGLLVPVIALALLEWDARLHAQTRARSAAAAQEEIAPTSRQLEQLAREIEKKQEQAGDVELRKIAEQLRKSADKLRAETTGAEDAAKAALRELSALEAMLAEVQKAPANPTAAEVKELAKSLEKSPTLSEAARAMQAGNLAEAGEQLEQAAREKANPAEAEKTLREALERLAEQRALSEALQNLAQQMQQGGAPGKGLEKLAQMLRQMAPGPAGQPGGPASPQMLKNLLAALQEMKLGEGQQGQAGSNPIPGPSQQAGISVQSFAQANGQSLPDGAQLPSGKPGGDRDVGTTESVFGKAPSESPEAGAAAGLKGQLGEGESLSQLLPSAGDTSKAQRRYRELYEAMAPAAEDAVVQENIPLGSRFFIKRYFESIRPKD